MFCFIYNMHIPIPKFARGGAIGKEAANAAMQGMEAFGKNIGASVSTKANVNFTVVRDETEALAHTLGTREGANVMIKWMQGNGTLLNRLFDLSHRR